MSKPSTSMDVAFSASVKQVQTERGSRAGYQRVADHGGFATEADDDLRAFLATADTAFLASANAAGQPYVQHRGGAPGFIEVVDDHTLAIEERRGNHQFITHGNLRDNPRVCLLVIDYAHKRRVKVWGTARVDGDKLVLSITAWDSNCPKYIPHKLDAAAVADALAVRDRRIAELERELAALHATRKPG
jgi:hypothetical protein|nr:pyridoxamine 5'-phosphate oxidase family protein [Kofleriaceae bacterium]